jgi:hypothetical protein
MVLFERAARSHHFFFSALRFTSARSRVLDTVGTG